jgi:cytoskeletal protein RodZ
MTNSTTDPKREPGYRGSLPPREDRLARPWILTVLGIFVLAIVLSVAGVPSRFIPDPTPLPTPSSTPVPSESPSAEPSESAEESAAPSASASAEASASASVEPSPSQ